MKSSFQESVRGDHASNPVTCPATEGSHLGHPLANRYSVDSSVRSLPEMQRFRTAD